MCACVVRDDSIGQAGRLPAKSSHYRYAQDYRAVEIDCYILDILLIWTHNVFININILCLKSMKYLLRLILLLFHQRKRINIDWFHNYGFFEIK